MISSAIPTAIQSGVAQVCGDLDNQIDATAQAWWPDTATGEELVSWERFLRITPPSGASDSDRQQVVIARLNAVGGVQVDWFYELAARLGWNKTSPKIELIDGQFFSFRVGISRVGTDKVYDNQVYGSLTCTIRYQTRGAALNSSLKALFERCRSYGTSFVWQELA